ncbi:MAG: hypothetical protein M0T81_03780 [Thermoplasmatales archaeon]|nr:hypothetical protein [Thermoplasmatales archaeon]
MTPEELESIEKVDIPDHLDVLTEPYNTYITVNTKPDALRVHIIPVLVTVNPFSTTFCSENRISGGDF